ncbi:hypothetical protein [Myxococcus sp. Y35]|uniref:hypothetical protein n=1 Tax=Pseudomyxococcus flavus TaxID=3115648 RepID=UPI003CEDFBAC
MSFAAAVLLVALSSSSVAAAPWTAVVRVTSEEDGALLARVRGQSSDLAVRLEPSPGMPWSGTPAEQWRAAEQLAARHQARAVLWFVREGHEVRVLVAELQGRHLFTRAAGLGETPGSLEWSAGAEALALAARSALRAVEAGAPLGEVVETVPSHGDVPGGASEQTVTAMLHRPNAGPSVPEPSARAERPMRRWWLSVGGHAALDGYTRAGHQGLSLGAGGQPGRARLRAQLLAGWPSRLRDARTEVTLGQYAASLWAGLPWALAERLDVEAGLGLGVVGFRRHTAALAPEVKAAPPGTMLAMLLGSELRARWRLAARVGVEASVSAEVLLGRPELRYAVDGNFVSRGDGWAVRPRLGLALVVFP